MLFSLSCFAIAFLSDKILWTPVSAVIRISSNGFMLYVSNLQIANLFSKFRTTVSNLINGSMAASLVVINEANIGVARIFNWGGGGGEQTTNHMQ